MARTHIHTHTHSMLFSHKSQLSNDVLQKRKILDSSNSNRRFCKIDHHLKVETALIAFYFHLRCEIR